MTDRLMEINSSECKIYSVLSENGKGERVEQQVAHLKIKKNKQINDPPILKFGSLRLPNKEFVTIWK